MSQTAVERDPFFRNQRQVVAGTEGKPREWGLHMSELHIAAAVGDHAAVTAMLASKAIEASGASVALLTTPDPLLQRLPLHLAAGAAVHPGVVRELLKQPSVDAEAVDGAGRTSLEMVRALRDEHLTEGESCVRLSTPKLSTATT